MQTEEPLMSIETDLENLESAEEFLDYFELEYDAGIVQVNRLHILQRFHDYLSKGEEALLLVFGRRS